VRDPAGREIDYLRISLTDRCNLRCGYCMPGRRTVMVDPAEFLTFDEIEETARAAAELGFRKIRLTGGEPLLRPGLPDLVRRLAAIGGITDLAMTTNGVFLAPLAAELRQAGLHRVNVSLDTLDPDRYFAITGGGELPAVLAGIDAAIEAGLHPVKLNCVVERDASEPDAISVAAFAARRGLEARFIPRMEMESGRFAQVIGGSGGDCPACNRLRLSCHGWILSCLFSEPAWSVRQLGAREALVRAIAEKPAAGGRCSRNWMHGIGG